MFSRKNGKALWMLQQGSKDRRKYTKPKEYPLSRKHELDGAEEETQTQLNI